MPPPPPELYLSLVLCSFYVSCSLRVRLWSSRRMCRSRTCRLPTCLRGWFRYLVLFSEVCFLMCVFVLIKKEHVFVVQVSMFCHGARVGFYQGDISLLMDDIKTLKPTFFPVVPRLLNRIYDKVSLCFPSLSFTRYLEGIIPCRLYFKAHFRFISISTDVCKDPWLSDLSPATGFASLRCEEEAGGAEQRGCT